MAASNSIDSRKRLLRAYLDAATRSEPLQTQIWHASQLTLAQVRVLRRLPNAPQSLGQLGSELALAPPSITRLVDRLEDRGLIARQRSEADRRKVVATLTEKGRDLVSAVPFLDATAIRKAVERMSAPDRERIAAALNEFISAVSQAECELVEALVDA